MKLNTLLFITYHYKVGEKEGKHCTAKKNSSLSIGSSRMSVLFACSKYPYCNSAVIWVYFM